MFENCKKVKSTLYSTSISFKSINTTNTGVICEYDGYVYLISYNTCVAVYEISGHRLYRTWFGFSQTTSRHISLFCKYINEKYNDGLMAFTYYGWKNRNSNALDKLEYISLSRVVQETRLRIQYKR